MGYQEHPSPAYSSNCYSKHAPLFHLTAIVTPSSQDNEDNAPSTPSFTQTKRKIDAAWMSTKRREISNEFLFTGWTEYAIIIVRDSDKTRTVTICRQHSNRRQALGSFLYLVLTRPQRSVCLCRRRHRRCKIVTCRGL